MFIYRQCGYQMYSARGATKAMTLKHAEMIHRVLQNPAVICTCGFVLKYAGNQTHNCEASPSILACCQKTAKVF
jgi:hypothetical protein